MIFLPASITKQNENPAYRRVRLVGPVRFWVRFAPASGVAGGHTIPYHFNIGRALFKMVRYVLLRPLRPEQNRPARRTGPTDRALLLKAFPNLSLFLPKFHNMIKNTIRNDQTV
jgi:hypothetical protein